VISIMVLLLVVFSSNPHAPLFVLPVLIGPVAPTVLALVVSRGLAYGMAEPARHSLYTRVPRNVRYKGQNAVDTAVWRFGDVAIATGMNGLKSVGMTIGGFAAISALAAFAAAGIGWRLWKRVERIDEPTAPR
jgi:AAA family ATP:ADP antiporter